MRLQGKEGKGKKMEGGRKEGNLSAHCGRATGIAKLPPVHTISLSTACDVGHNWLDVAAERRAGAAGALQHRAEETVQ